MKYSLRMVGGRVRVATLVTAPRKPGSRTFVVRDEKRMRLRMDAVPEVFLYFSPILDANLSQIGLRSERVDRPT
jgi:hypothetical protein